MCIRDRSAADSSALAAPAKALPNNPTAIHAQAFSIVFSFAGTISFLIPDLCP